MNRRAYVTALGGITIGLAGCTSSETDEPTSAKQETTTKTRAPPSTTSATAETTETTTNTPEPAEFSVESFHFPAEIGINEEFTPEITVRNEGEQYGDFTAPLYGRKDGGEWENYGEWTFRDVHPGGTVTAEAYESWQMYYVGTYEFVLGDLQETTSVEAVAEQRSFGGEYVTPSGIEMSVSAPDFKARYSREMGGSEDVVEAPNGKVFLFVDVSTQNTNEEPIRLPHYTDWQVLSENRQYEPDWDGYKDGRYEGGDVQPNVKRDGYLFYELPEDVDRENYRIVWSEEYRYGRATAFWSP